MVVQYTNAEYTVVLVFGYFRGNGRQCVRVYRKRFPYRHIPSHPTFAAVERRLRETGQLTPKTVDYGRQRFVRVPEVKEDILEHVAEEPEVSTIRLGSEIGVSKDVVHGVVKEQLLYS